LLQEIIRLSKTAALLMCCLILTDDSQAKPLAEKSITTAYVEGEKLQAVEPEPLVPALFRLSDWYRDNGSGGFADDFSDEHPRMDEWENVPEN
jgi:hypothetical protein